MDNYAFLKNLQITEPLSNSNDLETGESTPVCGQDSYTEDISPELAKRLLGDKFTEKEGARYQLIMDVTDTVVLTWLPDCEEPIVEPLESDNEVESLAELSATLHNPSAFRTEVLTTEKKEKNPINWTAVCVSGIFVLMLIGFAVLLFLFSLK